MSTRHLQENLTNFNSHAHVERDFSVLLVYVSIPNFNSHAHVERDESSHRNKAQITISTHTLTWSVTFRSFIDTLSIRNNFNSHAHVERDLLGAVTASGAAISTHTLTWSVTLDVVYIWCLLNVMRTYFFI